MAFVVLLFQNNKKVQAMDEDYVKHQLYLGNHQVQDETKMVRLPDSCYWVVMKLIGDREFVDSATKQEGKICLILNENSGKAGGLWPVMSFLSKDEAIALSRQLRRATGKGR